MVIVEEASNVTLLLSTVSFCKQLFNCHHGFSLTEITAEDTLKEMYDPTCGSVIFNRQVINILSYCIKKFLALQPKGGAAVRYTVQSFSQEVEYWYKHRAHISGGILLPSTINYALFLGEK